MSGKFGIILNNGSNLTVSDFNFNSQISKDNFDPSLYENFYDYFIKVYGNFAIIRCDFQNIINFKTLVLFGVFNHYIIEDVRILNCTFLFSLFLFEPSEENVFIF